MRHWGSNLKEGDVLLSNHPQRAGGRQVGNGKVGGGGDALCGVSMVYTASL